MGLLYLYWKHALTFRNVIPRINQYIAVAQNLYGSFLSLKNILFVSEIEAISLGKCSVHTSNEIVRKYQSSESSSFGNCRLYFGKRRSKQVKY
jgi:hypothetical protein